jgi:cell division protein FtsI/penicillin-binding protein 2
MVQIGLRVAPETLREYLLELRYATEPVTGLGGARSGKLPDWPWKTSYGHASVCYGYETQVTLWQHAAALAAVVRGGGWKPLRLLDAIEQRGRRWDLPGAEADPVFSARTCAEVREMMHQGALIGTGRHVFDGPPYEEDFVERYGVGTKTGTAERVHGEPCVHVELSHNEQHAQDQTGCSKACYASMKAQQRPHSRACKTLSMVAFGRRPSDDQDVLVLVVVDEPLQGSRYGSDTAGPAAGKLLREALGLTAFGAERSVERVAGFRRGARAPEPSSEQPWAEVGR